MGQRNFKIKRKKVSNLLRSELLSFRLSWKRRVLTLTYIQYPVNKISHDKKVNAFSMAATGK